MKKIFLLLFSCLSFFQASSQGTQQDSGLRFGLTLSPQLSWLSANDKGLEGNGSYAGFSYGLLMDVLIPTNYAFATGVLISYEGGKLTYTDSTKFNSFPDRIYPAGTSVDYTIQYIEIPLSMKLRTNQIGYITYFGQFGLQGGIAIRSRANIATLNGSMEEAKVDFGKDVTPGNLGLLLGGGIEYQVSGKTALLAGLQFHNGFIDATDNPKDYKTVSTLAHFRLQLGIYF
ncbi:MAG: outer membrane beta-barrel protein [Chitinophagaceae bacterium]|nr:outer membrane beta-barrel protein [Chitinophagaceae bacterium]